MWIVVLTVAVLLGATSCSAPATMPPPATVSVLEPGPPPPWLPWAHACAENEFPAQAGSRQYSGVYDREFERSAFTLEHSSCTVWLTGRLDDACKLVGGCWKHSRFTMHLTVSGELSPSGSYGHFGMYERQLQVDRVVSGTAIAQ